MDAREKIRSCIETCERMKREMEDSVSVPPRALGGNMRQEYEKAKRQHLMEMKQICEMLHTIE